MSKQLPFNHRHWRLAPCLAFLLSLASLPSPTQAQGDPVKKQGDTKAEAQPLGTWKSEVVMSPGGRKLGVSVLIVKKGKGIHVTVQVKDFPTSFKGMVARDGNKLAGNLLAQFGGRSIKAPFSAALVKGKLEIKMKVFRRPLTFLATRAKASPVVKKQGDRKVPKAGQVTAKPGSQEAKKPTSRVAAKVPTKVPAKAPAKVAANKPEATSRKAIAKSPKKTGRSKPKKPTGPMEGESLLVKPRKKAPKNIRPFKIDYGNRPAVKDCKVAKWGPDDYDSPDYAYIAKKIFPITSDPISNGVILVHRGKITAIGKQSEIKIPEGYKIVDGGEGWLFPGFLDLHCHIASGSFDLNDSVFANNPEFRTLDLIELHHPRIKKALQGGVTSALYIPGSGSNMGGFGTATKLAGKTVDEALIRFPGSLKIAQAGNPERRMGDMGASRMGMNFGIRQTLLRGKRYYELWEDYDAGKLDEKPRKDPALEYLRGLFRHEYPVSVHTQGYQVCLETIRELHDELGLWVFIDHGSFDAFKLSEIALQSGVPVANGPRMYQMDRDTGEMWGTAGLWARGGKHKFPDMQKGLGRDGIAINTDAPVVAQEELTVQATGAVRLGLPWEWAIRGLTINPARFLGVEHKIGSLEVGKDADIVLWTGDPLDPRRYVRKVMVSGTIYYDCDPGGKDHGKRRF